MGDWGNNRNTPNGMHLPMEFISDEDWPGDALKMWFVGRYRYPVNGVIDMDMGIYEKREVIKIKTMWILSLEC